MDPISASSFNLSTTRGDDNRNTIGLSTKSLSQYEAKNFKTLVPQILASANACSSHLVCGISLSFSAVLIPQLQSADSDIQVTDAQTSWIASVLALIAPFGAMLSGFLMDRYGRINALKMSVLPGVLGWLIMALSTNVSMLIFGRIVTGLSSSLSTSPAVVYLTEVSRKDMRGSLLSFGPAYVSLGMVVVLVKGWLMHWRTICYLSIGYVIVPFILLYFIPESPIWLLSKNRVQEAESALEYFHRHQPRPRPNRTFAQLQLEQLQIEQQRANNESKEKMNFFKEFRKPTGYKPMLILTFVFLFQQFSGIYIFLFYSVNFFQTIGTSVNPYVASIMIGIIRLIMSMVNTYLLKNFTRRILIMTSAAGMALSTLISAYYTQKVQNSNKSGEKGDEIIQFVPVVFLLLYVVFSMVGVLNIPWTMTAELFPLKIRSMAHSIATSIVNFIMFVAIQSYLSMLVWFGGSSGVQLFFAGVCFASIFYVYVFLPETHEKTLREIEEYFNENTVYVKCSRRGRKMRRRKGRVVEEQVDEEEVEEDVRLEESDIKFIDE